MIVRCDPCHLFSVRIFRMLENLFFMCTWVGVGFTGSDLNALGLFGFIYVVCYLH